MHRATMGGTAVSYPFGGAPPPRTYNFAIPEHRDDYRKHHRIGFIDSDPFGTR
jgi:hypothetical protein